MKPKPKTFYKRKLPHWQPPGATFFITWRLFGSLPQAALEELEAARRRLQREAEQAGETEDQREARHFKQFFASLDNLLDQVVDGPDWLRNEDIAALIEEALLQRYAALYQLWAYVVMPNHVHVFLKPKEDQGSASSDKAQTQYVPLQKITQALKGYSALEANNSLLRTGQTFWQEESYDHWARDEAEFYRIIAYIEKNPVKAGLAAKPEDWCWSSAAERKRRGLIEVTALT
jgi:putative transposase